MIYYILQIVDYKSRNRVRSKAGIAEANNDADGNTQTYNGWTYIWNGENRLIAAENSDTRLEFAYDYMGRRLYKKVYEADTLTSHRKFVYDGYKLAAEFDVEDNNALLASYLWQPESAGLDVPLMRIADNTEAYLHRRR